jgi:hypothetical protein
VVDLIVLGPKHFVKIMPRFQDWINTFMDFENRGHVFRALQKMIKTNYCCLHPDVAKNVADIFEEFGKLNVRDNVKL